jgi:dihydropteroate synthase
MNNTTTSFFQQKQTINLGGQIIALEKPLLMGILNVTPDSFYDGGKYIKPEHILEQTKKMLNEGADIIDIGAYSSKPGAAEISQKEEENRLLPTLDLIRTNFPDAILSVDTFRSEIADKVISTYNVQIINDISGGEADKEMFDCIAEHQRGYILMHMKGTPQNMQQLTHYDDLISEITDYFSVKIQQLQNCGVKDIIIDPGFGFAKTLEQNFQLLKNLNYFKLFDKPILAALSRKSMIWKTLNSSPEEALNGTTVLNTIALLNGANILRVHDVKEAREIIQLNQALKKTK